VRIGILGGTFDPIHRGHVHAAQIASERLRLDAVWLVPTGAPPHRTPPSASALDRFAMVCLASQDHPSFVPSSVEVERPGTSYTVDTVSRLREQASGATFHLIVGSDTFPEMGTWRDLPRLVTMCRVAVVLRPGAPALPAALPEWADPLEGLGVDVSATLVRKRSGHGEELSGLVAPCVAEHIRKRGLYR
jgi:nicotinate-nucleotide adenylyltransferase